MSKRLFSLLFISTLVVGATFAQSQDAAIADALQQIREEGTDRSQVMEIVHVLTDRYGARLTGSPTLDRAGEWVLRYTTDLGLTNAHKEPWDWGHTGWENDRLSAHIVSPFREPLVAEVLGWTPSTQGAAVGPLVHLVPPDSPTELELDAWLTSIRPGLRGSIVFVGESTVPSPPSARDQRRDDEQVAEQYRPDAGQGGAGNRQRPTPNAEQDEDAPVTLSSREVDQRLSAFLLENGAAVRVNASGMPDGLIRAFANRSYDVSTSVPTIILRTEDYGRLTRLAADGIPIELEIEVANTVYPAGSTQYNYVAELRGTEMPDEVVMIGGHLDAWHAGTGATDNGTGSAVMIEAMRILKTLDLSPRRTIRMALWGGEEQGLLGSQAYVADHFGTYEDPKPEYATFGGYINVDSGTGRLRGASVFGPVAAAEILHEMLQPMNDLGVAGARATSSRRLGGSDYTSFNQAGLPGISMGQDPIRYGSHTWHTNLDTYEQVLEDDVRQAAIVVASLAYQMAMADELLPRLSDEDMPQLAIGTQ